MASSRSAHPNPIVLDAAGRVPGGEIWLTIGFGYKFLLKDANNVLIGTYDNIPFLAHGLGSLIGAYIAALVAATHKMIFAVVIGVVHMIGGITMAFLIPAPTWFIILDLAAAYLPAAWIGGKLAFRRA